MANQIIQSTQPAEDEIDLSKLFGIMIDAKWFIIGVTLFFSVFGIAFALLSTPIYKADALIQIEKKSSGGVSSIVGDMGELFAAESSTTTEIEILKSRMILGDTVDEFNLTTLASPDYFPLVGKGLARINNSENYISVDTFEIPRTARGVSHKLITTDSEKGQFALTVEDKIVLSGSTGELIEMNGYRIKVSELISGNDDSFTLNKISRLDAIDRLESQLSISEKGSQTGIVLLSIEGEYPERNQAILNSVVQSYFLQNVKRNSAEAEKSLTFLKSHLPEIKEKLNGSEDVLNHFRQENESIDLNLEAQSTLKVMVALEAQLNELAFKESEVSQKFTQDHPAYKSLLDKRKTLLLEKERLNKQVQKLPKTQREVLRMTRDVEVNQQIYIQLLNKVQELNIIKAGTVGNVRIIDSAQSYSAAVKPKKSFIVVLATLLGGMVSVALVLIRSAFHRGVTSAEEIEQLGLPVYASVPQSAEQLEFTKKLNRIKGANDKPLLLAEANPADLSIEALRGLRTSLHFAMMEAKNNVLMISGPAPSLGKSFVSTNFAAVAAKTGQKVLLVDADMRKGYLQKSLGLRWDNGLSELLSGKISSSDAIKTTSIENLDVVTRGQVPPNPSELLMHPRFKNFVDKVSAEYDLVIIDTPPVLAVTDPTIVGAIAGTTLMVTRFEQTTLKEINIAHNRFEQAGVEVKGVLLNAIEKKASNAYGYYNYSYTNE
ncbi:protein involved in exopolysaccharide biosynthesis [Vibrio sp. B1FLJ16]|uniref:polysaccharide biosynthesis tyrosine autokinase n=1 Tax=Vibrio sp. B1FLJ16 TaxID=2751178 RepID=UPI0015F38CC9|nr:polysaccharide biosynthesis tyrosine autokinase [Vibrio sp. B1FLJ16]CAD7823834.1 protein involved in exopolysaccharide biosynthesis [Vibrio sp. B1FLJ16]CAE6952871.1 protein involved in exopolysaccharide biosynthesis [Vibrio sp. B1FLJ16]